MSFSKIQDYYRVLDPKIDIESDRVRLANPTAPKSMTQPGVFNKIFETYITRATPGSEILADRDINNDKNKLYYNTVNQLASNPQANFLFPDYWKYSQGDSSNKNQSSNSTLAYNFYKEICGAASDVPPADLTINVLRSPFLSLAFNQVDEVTTFLNHMPAVFASKMVPYFDLEIQFPQLAPETDKRFLNKASLLRFLLGSKDTLSGKPLSAADKSLINAIRTPTEKNSNQDSHFVGMEIFTAPQILTNMDGLNANGDRLNDVKPFLPMASLTSANVQAANAGAGAQISTSAQLEFKIHDKNRLVEFVEVLIPGGLFKVGAVFWLTFGWLAPRGDEHDEYAKFINQKMLTRMAFKFKNHSFSFDATGQVTVTVQLVSQTVDALTKNTIDSADDTNLQKMQNAIAKLKELSKRINEKKRTLGEPNEEIKDVKIFQVINSAANFNKNEIDIPKKTAFDLLNKFEKTVKSGKTLYVGNAATEALDLIKDLKDFYDASELEEIRNASDNYITTRLSSCYNKDSADPFLPSSSKSAYFSQDLIDQIEKVKVDYKKFDEELAKALKEWDGSDFSKKPPSVRPSNYTKSVVSFGKLFSVFCVPVLLKTCKDEGIDELQINFYQFNGSCGPISYHSIAEFPIDIRLFVSQFQSFIEKRGGDALTVGQFVGFIINNAIKDKRSLAYGMQDQYMPYELREKELKRSKDFDDKYTEWMAKYKSFTSPVVTIFSEVKYVEEANSTNVNMLDSIASFVGDYYEKHQQQIKGSSEKKKIKKIHIYDRAASPYNKNLKIFSNEADTQKTNEFIVIPEAEVPEFARAAHTVSGADPDLAAPAILLRGFNSIAIPGFEVPLPGTKNAIDNLSRVIPTGRNVLREYYSNTIPTIEYGVEGTLVKNINIASQTDGLIGTIYIQGGAGKVKSDLTDNGLTMAVNNLPVVASPVQMSMTTAGCPLAQLYQQFYIDMGTGTTIDNAYTATQVQHSFAPGKFETNWTFTYVNGYGQFFTPGNLSKAIKDSFQSPTPARPPRPAKKKTGTPAKPAAPPKK